MPDGMSITVDCKALLEALNKVGPAVEQYTKAAARVTATNVRAEAQRRVRRRTGATMEGILMREDYSGKGYVVVTQDVVPKEEKERRLKMGMRRNRKSVYFKMPHTWLYLEEGTTQGRWPSHTLPPRPFFYPAAQVEQGPHRQRMAEAITRAVDEVGLGE